MNASQTSLFIVNVEAAVVKDGRYLMVVRSEQEAHAGGTLSFPGGKVDFAGPADAILETTAQREVQEETGVTIDDQCVYVESKAFGALEQPVVDIVLLCRYAAGAATPVDPDEVAAILWLTAEEVLAHPLTQPWTAQSIRLAEALRRKLEW